MRFSRTLHPEIILDKRGEKSSRELYRKIINMIKVTPEGIRFETDADPMSYFIAETLTKDSVFLRFMASCKIFLDRKAPVYHIGRDFLLALQKIDRQIPLDILPESFIGYFSFSDNTIFDESCAVEGGYVCIGRGREMGMKSELADTRMISFSYVCKSDEEMPPFGSLTIPLEGRKIEELASEVETVDFFLNQQVSATDSKKRNDVFRTLLNAVIYIHSEEPIIERSRPLEQSGLSVKQHKKQDKIINACTIPISFLNPKYIQTKVYQVESTWIETFPRWQRCGPGLKSVKLVFVTPHERKYNTEGKAESE
jgi:hypothetical protein